MRSERRAPAAAAPSASGARSSTTKKWLIGSIAILGFVFLLVSQSEILTSSTRETELNPDFVVEKSSQFDALDDNDDKKQEPGAVKEKEDDDDDDDDGFDKAGVKPGHYSGLRPQPVKGQDAKPKEEEGGEEKDEALDPELVEDFQLPVFEQIEIFEEEVKEIQEEKDDFAFKEEDIPVDLEQEAEDLTNPAVMMKKGFVVTYPHTNQECFESLVVIETTNKAVSDKWQKVSLLLACGSTPHDIPFGPLYDSPKDVWRFGAKFFPDGACMNFSLSVQTTDSSVKIFRGHEMSFTSLGLQYDNRNMRHLCWDCTAVLDNSNPRGYFFGLADEKGRWITKSNEPTVVAGEELVLFIKPLPQIAEAFKSYIPHLSWNAWITNEKIFRHARVSITFDTIQQGYEIKLFSRDVGIFDLHVTLDSIFALNEVTEPEPIHVSSHLSHYHSSCNENRASPYQSIKINVVDGPKMIDLQKSQVKRCEGSEAFGDGRWVYLPLTDECEPPFCTGDRFPTLISAMSWQGHRYPYIWLPYDCYLHFYTFDDYQYCAKKKDIDWIHTFGDSLVREMPAYYMSIYGVGDLSKFHLVDQMLNDTMTRITFWAWGDIMPNKPGGDALFAPAPEHYRDIGFTKWMYEHFNILQHSSSQESLRFNITVGWTTDEMAEDEFDHPDVLLMNPNMAYVLYLQSEKAWHKYIEDLSDLVKPEFSKPDQKISKKIWYGQPHVFGPAHPGTPHLTESRNRLFSEWARPHIEEMGFVYLDTSRMTLTRPEEAWDGLHFLRTGTAIWTGHVSASIGQLILNYVFEDCTSDPNDNN